jgi:hypothetical protein
MASVDDNKIVSKTMHFDKGSALIEDARQIVPVPGIYFHETC